MDKEKIQDHWNWVNGLLESMPTHKDKYGKPLFTLDTVKYLFTTAMEQGWLQGVEDQRKESRPPYFNPTGRSLKRANIQR